MAPITQLRDIVPIRPLTFPEALYIAERQATKLLTLNGLTAPAVPEAAISEQPRIEVERIRPLPMAGGSHPYPGRWVILLNAADLPTRQRFSLAHEYKHVLDDPFIKVLYPAAGGMTTTQRAEQVCNYFAGCLLIPRLWLKRAWAEGLQDVRALARLFDVSVEAMRVRLLQIGLIQQTPRHLLSQGATS